MKKIILVTILINVYSSIFSQTTYNPEFSRRNHPNLSIISVETTNYQTIIKYKLYYPKEKTGIYSIWIARNTYLTASHIKYKLIKAENIAYTQPIKHDMVPGDTKHFTLYFEPLAKSVEVFDMIEKPNSDKVFNIYGIRIKKSTNNDNVPPEISITYPNVKRGYKIVEQKNQVTIKGNVKDKSGIFKVLVNGQEAYVDKQGNFTKTVLLAFGDNSFTVIATDLKQNTRTKEFIIERISKQQQTIVVNNQTNNTGLQTGKYYALIIGVQDYRNPGINDLDQPISDAQKLYNVLLNNYTFENRNMKFLKNPTKSNITDALDYYSNILTENDNLLIFYAGHGHWDKKFKQGYWLASDANKNKRGTWLSNGIIRDYMQGIPAKHSLLITDACFGGGIFKSRDAFANASVAINQLYKLPSRKALTSGALSEVPDKSVFIEYLVKRLGQNTAKYLSSEQLFASFKIAVINNSSTGQVPQFGEVKETGDEGGDFIFIRK